MSRYVPLGLFGLLLAGLFVISTIATHNTLTKPYPGHNDFLSRWEPARAYWLEGLNPYGEEASLNIQYLIYGRPVLEYEDPGYFVYPFYTVFFMWPVVHVSYAWASAIWMVLLEFCLIGALLLILRLVNWRPSGLMLMALVAWNLISYFPARGLILGQVGIVVYFFEILALWALARERDDLAGVALALSTLKPQMGYLLVPFLLLAGLVRWRRRFLISFCITFGLLMGLSFLMLPTWLSDWIAQVRLYPSYTDVGNAIWVVANAAWLQVEPTGRWIVTGGFGPVIEFALVALLSLWMAWAWWCVLVQGRFERFFWTVILTLTVTHLVAPRTATTHYVVFTLPFIYYLRWLVMRFRRGNWLVYGLLLALFILQWAHHTLFIVGDIEHPSVFVPVPFAIAGLLWFTRKMWWHATRDPFRNWAQTPAPFWEAVKRWRSAQQAM